MIIKIKMQKPKKLNKLINFFVKFHVDEVAWNLFES